MAALLDDETVQLPHLGLGEGADVAVVDDGVVARGLEMLEVQIRTQLGGDAVGTEHARGGVERVIHGLTAGRELLVVIDVIEMTVEPPAQQAGDQQHTADDEQADLHALAPSSACQASNRPANAEASGKRCA